MRFVFGEWYSSEQPLTVEDAKTICEKADRARDRIRNLPFDKIESTLKAMSQFWGDPQNPIRVKAIDELSESSGYAKEMVALGMDNLSQLLDPCVLQAKIDTELRGIPVARGYYFDANTQTSFQWQPLGTVLHVLAGNVFSGGPGSWIEGVLTRNVTILKMSSSEKVFLPLFIKSLEQCDTTGALLHATCVIDYSSQQTEVMKVFKQQVDGIVVWGGEQAVRGYRDDLPARTKLIVFGPKLSLSIATAAGLEEAGLEKAAKSLAGELAIWDQNACTAPQVCYVESNDAAETFAHALVKALADKQQEIPAGQLDLQTAVEIRKLRGVFEVAQAQGQGLCLGSANDLSHTVFLDPKLDLEPSPLHRTIRVIPYTDIGDVLQQVDGYRGYVQTVGLTSSAKESWGLSQALYGHGVIRVVGLGQMAGGEINDPHDGAFDLPQLLNLTLHRSHASASGIDPIDLLPLSERQSLLDEKFRRLLFHAKQSAYYGQALERFKEGIGRDPEGLADLQKLPVLSRVLMEAHMPPGGNGLATEPQYHGGYVSRSGGSTGEPKFSIYDGRDWEASMENGVRLFRALGLKPGDRLANCMMSGDLYGGFVSFDHINVRLGVTTFAFSTKLEPKEFLRTWRLFKINAIQGVPNFVVPRLRECMELDPSFTLETFIYAGQPLSHTDREWLNTKLKIKRIGSIIGANDGNQIAFQCGHMRNGMHHLIDDYNFVEVVDEDGNPVEDGDPGKILITTLEKYQFPLIRYDIGDRGRIVPGNCDCGRTTRRFEFLGRSNDQLSLGLMNLDYSAVERTIAGLGFTAMQLVAKVKDNRDSLIVRIETESPGINFEQKVRNCILASLPEVQNRIDQGHLAAVEVESFGPGCLPRDGRSSKIKNVLDER